MFPVELSKGFLDISMEFLGSVLARFVDLSIIEKGHTFVNILALIYDCQGVDDVFSIIPKGNRDKMLQYLSSIDPHIKFTIEQPNKEGGIPFLDTFPKPKAEGIAVSVYRKPTHMNRYLDFNSSHPISAKRAVVRALMDQAENVCSDPDILAKEMEHLNRVPHYNNYPQWMIDKWGKSDKHNPIIHPETGVEI